ncbi:unnamed protein product [Rhodiola kirilowii]
MARGRPRGGAAAADRDIEDFRVRETADLHRQVDYLTRRLGELEAHHADAEVVAEDNPFAGEANNQRVRRWELGFKVDIPNFDGGLKAEEFIDWLSRVEEILDFKDVHDDHRVSLVTFHLRGRAQAWWQHMKKSRVREGKAKIATWQKFVKHIRQAFLPYNFERELYQRFQNLRQGVRSVDEYTANFFQLLARTDVRESPLQLVSRYIGGLKLQLQDVLNMFDPATVSEAHQRALQVEKQLARRGPGGFHQSPGVGATPTAPATRGPATPVGRPADHPAQIRSGGVIRYFGCGEKGHRQAECPKVSSSRGLFTHDGPEDVPVPDGDPVFDVYGDDVVEEDVVSGDMGPLLMLRRTFLTPRAPDHSEWLRTNVFQSSCTIGGKVCTFIIDAGNCENVISEVAVSKLALTSEPQPKPYKLAWLSEGTDITVTKCVLVSFSIGATYSDETYCDVVPMDACHLLLGRPWQFDRSVVHDGRTNTYSFLFRGKKIVLVPSKSRVASSIGNPPSTNLLSQAPFQGAMQESEVVYGVVPREPSELLTLPSHVRTLDVVNVQHLIPFQGTSSDTELGSDSRTNLLDPGGDDVDRLAENQDCGEIAGLELPVSDFSP